MKFYIEVTSIKTIYEIPGCWSESELRGVLEALGISDAADIDSADLFDMLELALSDLPPVDVAQMVLAYKLGEKLTEGQIQNMSHDMLEDNQAEEYPDISLHYDLFNINQVLYRAYNGKFPHGKASKIDFILTTQNVEQPITKEIVLRALTPLLALNNVVVRLYSEVLDSDETFEDAESIIWSLQSLGKKKYTLVTSDYWINREDLMTDVYSGEMSMHKSY